MTITQNAAANIAAYGQHFARHEELHLLYALHGRVPYQHVPELLDAMKERSLPLPGGCWKLHASVSTR
jgi:hypothetical protein